MWNKHKKGPKSRTVDKRWQQLRNDNHIMYELHNSWQTCLLNNQDRKINWIRALHWNGPTGNQKFQGFMKGKCHRNIRRWRQSKLVFLTHVSSNYGLLDFYSVEWWYTCSDVSEDVLSPPSELQSGSRGRGIIPHKRLLHDVKTQKLSSPPTSTAKIRKLIRNGLFPILLQTSSSEYISQIGNWLTVRVNFINA